jgi:hypothetical protein
MDGTIAGQEPGCKDPLSNPAFLRSAEKVARLQCADRRAEQAFELIETQLGLDAR